MTEENSWLTRIAEKFDLRFPLSRQAFYFTGASHLEFNWDQKDVVGYRLIYRVDKAYVPDAKVELKGDWAYGPRVEARELFQRSYRTLPCSRCDEKKPSSPGFHSRVKSPEGPFKELWGRKDSFCKDCRSLQKAASYAKKTRKQEKQRKLCESVRSVIVGTLRAGAMQRFAEILAQAAKDISDGNSTREIR